MERKLRATGARARHQTPVLEVQGHKAAAHITGVPVDTGRLAAGVRNAKVKAGPWGFVLLTDVPYARYVFRGTATMAARPPQLPSSVGRDTARAISADLERAQ
jgi:hypothetical protein